MRKNLEKLEDSIIIKLFNANGYKIVGEIKNTTTPILCEKDGFWYKITYNNLRYGKNPSLWGFNNICNLEHNINAFIAKRGIKAEFVSYSIVTHNKKRRILLTFRCECGKLFNKFLEESVYKTYICCNECVKKKRGVNHRKCQKNIDAVLNARYKILSAPDLLRYDDLIEVEDADGFRGFISSAKIGSGKGMSRFDERINKKYYIYNVNKWAELNAIDSTCIGFVEKQHTRTSLLFRCSCGNEFITSIASFQNGKTRCEKCAKSISKYEYEFRAYLDSVGIKYIHQYSIDQCRDILPLPFDFFIKEYNVLVEIDGEGHYYPCNFNQIGAKKAQATFEITKEHDVIKNEFCKNNNIPLLRIPYTSFKDGTYKQLFQNFIRGVATSS